MTERLMQNIPPFFSGDNPVIGRINAYYKAYGTDYDFCKFYSSENMLIMCYEGEFFVYGGECGDYDETAFFLSMQGAQSILADAAAYNGMRDKLCGYSAQKLYCMERSYDEDYCAQGKFTEDYSAVYEVLKSAFRLGEDSFSHWYTDTCHRVRHGISRLVSVGEAPVKATATVLYENDDYCFLSHIGVRHELFGGGYGRRLLDTAQALCRKNIRLLCKSGVKEFYTRCGFSENERLTAYQMIKEANNK